MIYLFDLLACWLVSAFYHIGLLAYWLISGWTVLWNKMLKVGDVPTVLARIRIVGIDKESGGLRPLGISSEVWRAGASALMEVLSP